MPSGVSAIPKDFEPQARSDRKLPMMTMLHSVWSGGGSAAGRRRSLLALGALLAMVASVLIWAAPAQAQNQAPPIAIAVEGNLTGTTQTLDGSNSFDPDSDGEIVAYKWEVVTEAYSWLALSDEGIASPTFTVPSLELAARYGQSIEFKLTVTDNGTPAASASTTLTFEINQRPTADIAVAAHLLEEDGDADDIDHYSVDAVIAGPGEDGNADNEWDIMENALLVLDGSGSSDANGRVLSYAWDLIYPITASDATDIGLSDDTTGREVSTDADNGGDIETISNITMSSSPFYAYYTLTVTDNDGVTSPGAVVKLVIWDQPATPEIEISAADGDENAATDVQKSNFPTDTPKYIVSPGGTVVITAAATDGDDPDTVTAEDHTGTTIVDYTWTGGEAQEDDPTDTPTPNVDESDTQRVVKVDRDAEDGTIISVSVAVTDRTGLTGTASVDLQVVAGNTAPTAEILNRNLIANTTNPAVAADYGRDGTAGTPDGNIGGDRDADGDPTGVITLRAVGFDPDQPANTLIYSWRQLHSTTFMAIEDPDDYEEEGNTLLEMEGALTDTVTITVPELGNNSDQSEDFNVLLAVLDQYGALGRSIITITVNEANSAPVADAGDDQIVEPGDFVRLNGAGSADPDKGETITNESHVWAIKSISTTPGPRQVLKSVRDQALKDLNAWYEAWTNADQAGDTDENVGTLAQVLSGAPGRYPYFDAPKVADGLANVQLTFTLTVTDGADATDDDDVTITITNRFYSGNVTGPNFCTGMSLGGPRTFAFDGDGDGVADVCALNTTRRATVAIQNALETLVAIGSTLSRTDAGPDNDADNTVDNRTSEVGFAALVTGQAGVNAVSAVGSPGDADYEAAIPAVAAVTGTCDTIPGLDKLGDSDAALASDACSDGGKVSGLPAPPDPATADVFFSGVITGANYCTDLSLGGSRTYAFDSDGDGVADTCSLPYTLREAVARQVALEMYKAHAQYKSALAAACTALGSTAFGDSEAALANDECSPSAQDPVFGTDLPAPTS